MLLEKMKSKNRKISFEKMSNVEVFKRLQKGLGKVPPKRLVQYLEEEICVGNLIVLFRNADFEGQKYLIRLLPEKKLKNMINFCNFLYFEDFANFLSNLAKEAESTKKKKIFEKIGKMMETEDIILKMLEELNESTLGEILSNIQEGEQILLICETALKLGKEKQILAIFQEKLSLKLFEKEKFLNYEILYSILYQIDEMEFVEFYKGCSKTAKIELLERIFATNSNQNVEELTLQYKAKLALEETKLEGKMTITEELFLNYANKMK